MHVCVEKCPLTTRHMANAAVAAGEQECRALLKELWRDVHPEADADHGQHVSEHSVQVRTVRNQAAHGTGRDRQTDK